MEELAEKIIKSHVDDWNHWHEYCREKVIKALIEALETNPSESTNQ